MGPALEDELQPIFEQLLHALVEATPEWWTTAELVLTAPDGVLGCGLSNLIQSAEHPRDVVVATDVVFEATRALELASIRHGDRWQRCVFRIAQQPSGAWRYTADFER